MSPSFADFDWKRDQFSRQTHRSAKSFASAPEEENWRLRYDSTALRSAEVVGAATTRNRQGTVVSVSAWHGRRRQVWPVIAVQTNHGTSPNRRTDSSRGNGAGAKAELLSFHSLRHSFVSALANAGVASDLRQKLAGHTDSKSHARYSHHEVAAMRLAIGTVPSLRKL